MTDDRLSDAALLSRIRAGDQRAYDVLHARHRPALLRHARRMLGATGGRSEDVVQDAFLRAHRTLMDAERRVEVKPWLFRIVHNLCLDELRRSRLVLVRSEDEDELPGREDAFAAAARREQLREVVADVRDLPPRQRFALVEHVLAGTPHDDLARELGITALASRNLVHRARSRLAAAGAKRAA